MAINVEEYYKKYAPMILRRAKWILKDEDKAYDALQETFIRLIKNQYKLKDKYPSSLLYTMATNVCLNMIRSENRKAETKDEELLLKIAKTHDDSKRIELNDILDRIFMKEKVSTKLIAFMHYVDKMTLKEVADEVGLSVSGVRKRLRNLRINAKNIEGDIKWKKKFLIIQLKNIS